MTTEQVPSKESFSWPTSKGDPIGPVWSYGGKKGMYQAEALRAFAHDLVDRIKEFELPVREAMKAASGDGLDAFAYCRLLQRQKDNLLRALNAKQAKIDALMLEFCPGEMSADQRAEYAKAQQPTHEPGQVLCPSCGRVRFCDPKECGLWHGAAQPPLSEYLKDGETAAECIERNRRDVVQSLGMLAAERAKTDDLATAVRLLHVWRSWALTPSDESDPAREDMLYPHRNGRGELYKEVNALLAKHPYSRQTKGESRS